MQRPIISFDINSYPKSFASIEKGSYRLNDFLHLSDNELEEIYLALEKFIIERSSQTIPLTEHRDYQYLESGWEWSVFKKDDQTVIKIPSGVFPEINDPLYITNSQKSYDLLKKYYPARFIPITKYSRQNEMNQIEQEFVFGKSDFTIDYQTTDQVILQNFILFLEASLRLAEEERLLPDFWFAETEDGVLLKNVILEDKTRDFKIIDFTQYFDHSKMYPAKSEKVLTDHIARMNQLLAWATNRLSELK